MVDQAIQQIFLEGRTHRAWIDRAVEDATLQEAYALARLGPTSANCCPMRVVFVKTAEAKARLKPHLDSGNVDQTMAAPVTAIIGYDLAFYDWLPKLYPHVDARSWFAGNPPLIQTAAFRNGSLQGAYFMLAARAVGLDCGPMSGFDNEGIDRVFFDGTEVKSNFLCNLGYGNPEKLYPRQPRFEFHEVCHIV